MAEEAMTKIVNRHKGEEFSTLFERWRIFDGNHTSLEQRLYIYSTLLASLACLIGLIWNWYIELSYALNTIVGFVMIAFAFLYYFGRFKSKFYPTILVIIAQIGLSLTWFTSGGFDGSVFLFFLISISLFIALSKGNNHLIYIGMSLVNIIALFYFEKSKYSYLIIQYPDKASQTADIAFSFLISFILLYLLTLYIVNSFRKENTKVSEQKKELELVNTTKDKFFSIIAHDLRGPFNGMIGLTKIMSDNSVDFEKEELQDLALKLNKSATSTYGLLENLLNWAKVQQDCIAYHPHKIPLKNFVSAHLQAHQEMANNKEINTANTIPVDMMVLADEFMLQTIISNFIINAIKFTAKGGNIAISAIDKSNGKIEVSITDTGLGMSQSIISTLFKLGEQEHRVGTENEPSSGLGLILCKEFVEKHGGIIGVESEEGKGAKFTFSLPSAN